MSGQVPSPYADRRFVEKGMAVGTVCSEPVSAFSLIFRENTGKYRGIRCSRWLWGSTDARSACVLGEVPWI